MTNTHVNDALTNLKSAIFAAIPPEYDIAASVCNSEIERHPDSQSRDIQSICPGDGYNTKDAATGGWFTLNFPGPAGREAGRLMESVIAQALNGAQWAEMQEAFPQYNFRTNPIRTIGNVTDAGAVHFVISDAEAGLLARRLNEMAHKVKQHSTAIADVIEVAERHGPGLQRKGIGKLWPCVNGLMDEHPSIRLRLDVANYQSTLQNSLQSAGAVRGRGDIRIYYRDKDEPLPATEFFAQLPQLSNINKILGDLGDRRSPKL